jgi:hypothetical protein
MPAVALARNDAPAADGSTFSHSPLRAATLVNAQVGRGLTASYAGNNFSLEVDSSLRAAERSEGVNF